MIVLDKDTTEFFLGETKVKIADPKENVGKDEIEKILNTIALLYKNTLKNPEDKNYKQWQPFGADELGHLEMIGAIVYQLTKNLTEKEIKEAGFEDYFVDHTLGIYPQYA